MARVWEDFPHAKRVIVEDAMTCLEAASVTFVLMVFNDDGMGAILSNCDPRQAAGPLEEAARAARSGVDVDPIRKRAPLS